MGWKDRKDPYDAEDAFEDEYFDGNDLDKDLLYDLHDEDDYDFTPLEEDQDN